MRTGCTIGERKSHIASPWPRCWWCPLLEKVAGYKLHPPSPEEQESAGLTGLPLLTSPREEEPSGRVSCQEWVPCVSAVGMSKGHTVGWERGFAIDVSFRQGLLAPSIKLSWDQSHRGHAHALQSRIGLQHPACSEHQSSIQQTLTYLCFCF